MLIHLSALSFMRICLLSNAAVFSENAYLHDYVAALPFFRHFVQHPSHHRQTDVCLSLSWLCHCPSIPAGCTYVNSYIRVILRQMKVQLGYGHEALHIHQQKYEYA